VVKVSFVDDDRNAAMVLVCAALFRGSRFLIGKVTHAALRVLVKGFLFALGRVCESIRWPILLCSSLGKVRRESNGYIHANGI
jgi:hypothetical protein